MYDIISSLIQLLNIAGTGPIFGALMGACFGPIVFLPATGVQSRKKSVLMDDSDSERVLLLFVNEIIAFCLKM